MKTKNTTKRVERTDVHCPKNFRPEDYEYKGVIYLDFKNRSPLYRKSEAYLAPRKLLDEKGWKGGNFANKNSTCDHCGAYFLYGALFLHKPTDEVIVVGYICADEAFGCDSRREYDYKKLKKAIDKEVKEAKIAKKAEETIAKFSLTKDEINSRWGWKIRYNLNNGNDIGEEDVLWLRNKIKDSEAEELKRKEEEEKREAERIAFEKAKAEKLVEVFPAVTPVEEVPEGNIQITGEVLGKKAQYFMRHATMKILVKDSRGFKVWGTNPSGIYLEKGNLVTFTANVEKSRNDKMFGYFKYPKDAKLIEIK